MADDVWKAPGPSGPPTERSDDRHAQARLGLMGREAQLRALGLVYALAAPLLCIRFVAVLVSEVIIYLRNPEGGGVLLVYTVMAFIPAFILVGPVLFLAGVRTWTLGPGRQVWFGLGSLALLGLVPFGTAVGVWGLALWLTGGGLEVLGAYWYKETYEASTVPTEFRAWHFLVPGALAAAQVYSLLWDVASVLPR